MHYINLVSLKQMLPPMRQHNKHKNLQPALVPACIELLGEACIRSGRTMNIGNRRIRNRHSCPPRRLWTHSKIRPRSHLTHGGVNNEIILEAHRSRAILEVEVRLQENELPIRILRINRGNDALAPRMAIVKGGAERSRDWVVGAQVADVGQSTVTIAR